MNVKELKAEYAAMPADVRNGEAGQALAKEINRRSRKVAVVDSGNLRPPQGDYKPQTVDEFKKDLAARMASGKQSAIIMGDDGNARIVDMEAVRGMREIRTANIKEINAALKPMPMEVRRVGNNRNLPCPCGSGRKFKKCCFYNIAPVTIEP